MKSLIGDKKFYRMVLIVCIPIVIQNGFTNLASLLDNIMIGQLGTLSMSGVSISNQLFQVFNVSVFGAMSGAGIFLAQFYGRGNRDGVHNCFRIKMLLCILISILAICIFKLLGPSLISLYLNDDPTDSMTTLSFGKQYMDVMLIGLIPFAITQVYSSSLRETGNTVLPMKASVIAVIVNFCINYILIFGHFGFPKLGVIGAAIGTVVSRIVEMGINIAAAINVTTTVTNFFMIICYAMGNSISIIVGQRLGAGEIEYAKDCDLKMVFMNFMMCLCIGVALFGCSSFIPQIYNTSIEVKSLATSLLRVSACMLPIISLYYSSYFTMRAGGKTLLTFFFDSGYTFIFTFMVALCLTRFTNLPIFNVYLLVQCVDIPKAVLGITLVKKGIWVHNIVNEL